MILPVRGFPCHRNMPGKQADINDKSCRTIWNLISCIVRQDFFVSVSKGDRCVWGRLTGLHTERKNQSKRLMELAGRRDGGAEGKNEGKWGRKRGENGGERAQKGTFRIKMCRNGLFWHVEYLHVTRQCKLDLTKYSRKWNRYKEMGLLLPADEGERRSNRSRTSAKHHTS